LYIQLSFTERSSDILCLLLFHAIRDSGDKNVLPPLEFLESIQPAKIESFIPVTKSLIVCGVSDLFVKKNPRSSVLLRYLRTLFTSFADVNTELNVSSRGGERYTNDPMRILNFS